MTSKPATPLATWPVGQPATIAELQVPAALAEWTVHLSDLGFLPGETVQVLRRAPLGGDPLVVRVGSSTFALRRAEAACVRVLALASAPPRGLKTAEQASGFAFDPVLGVQQDACRAALTGERQAAS